MVNNSVNIQSRLLQGTVLGPIHFSVFFFSVKQIENIVSYADDTILIYNEEIDHKHQ